MIAEVIIDSKAKKLNRKFDYKIPEKLADSLYTHLLLSQPRISFFDLTAMPSVFTTPLSVYVEHALREPKKPESATTTATVRAIHKIKNTYFFINFIFPMLLEALQANEPMQLEHALHQYLH